MSKILIIAEHDGARLNASTAKCVTCASAIAGRQHRRRGVRGRWRGRSPPRRRRSRASRKVLRGREPRPTRMRSRRCSRRRWQRSAAAIPTSSAHRRPSARTSCRASLRCSMRPQLSDIMAVESATRFRRPIYAGNAIVTVEVDAGTRVVATVRPASFQPAGDGGSAAIESVSVDAALPTHTRFVSVSAPKTDRPDLQIARKVVSGGRAMASADNFKILFSLADKLGAAVGASRAAVDAGYAAERPAGRPDRQDHRARKSTRRRHLGRDPAHDRHQGRAHDRRGQQGS